MEYHDSEERKYVMKYAAILRKLSVISRVTHRGARFAHI